VNWRDYISPWAVGGIALWLLVMALVTPIVIPIFANVAGGPAEFCLQTTCTTTEWLPSLGTAAIAASLVVGGLWGAVTLLRSRS
jgi:hypothetical protein